MVRTFSALMDRPGPGKEIGAFDRNSRTWADSVVLKRSGVGFEAAGCVVDERHMWQHRSALSVIDSKP